MYYIILIFSFLGIIKQGNNNYKNKYYELMMYIFLMFISAFRVNIGTDFNTYTSTILYYKNGINSSWLNYEPGFILLNKVFSRYTNSGQLIIIVSSIITISIFFYVFLHNSEDVRISIFLFISLYFYNNSFNLIRQFIAISIVLISIKYLSRKLFKKYLICILIASMFHSTALLMIPFYFVQRIKWKFSTIICCSVISIILLLLYDYCSSLIFVIFPKYSMYEEAAGGGSIYNLLFSLLCVTMLIYIKINKIYRFREEKVLNIYLSSAVLTIFVTMFSFKIVFFARASFYFFSISLLSVPFCMKRIKGIDLFVFKSVTILYSIIIYIHYINNNIGGVVPYEIWNFNNI